MLLAILAALFTSDVRRHFGGREHFARTPWSKGEATAGDTAENAKPLISHALA
jgi:hypothetical protein